MLGDYCLSVLIQRFGSLIDKFLVHVGTSNKVHRADVETFVIGVYSTVGSSWNRRWIKEHVFCDELLHCCGAVRNQANVQHCRRLCD